MLSTLGRIYGRLRATRGRGGAALNWDADRVVRAIGRLYYGAVPPPDVIRDRDKIMHMLAQIVEVSRAAPGVVVDQIRATDMPPAEVEELLSVLYAASSGPRRRRTPNHPDYWNNLVKYVRDIHEEDRFHEQNEQNEKNEQNKLQNENKE